MTIDKNIRLLKKGEVEEKRRRRRGEREEQLFPFFYDFDQKCGSCVTQGGRKKIINHQIGVVVYKLRSPE